MHLYVPSGREKRRLLKDLPESTLYEKALLFRVDSESGAVETCVEYVSPPDACPVANGSVSFRAGTLANDRLYLCTLTEIFSCRLPGFAMEDYISIPCFNDVHHVCPTPQGSFLVCSTGLDMVVEVAPGGKVLRRWNVLGGDPWGRFSPDVDYRMVHSTKPHQSHPNFVFRLGNQIWVTRFNQMDAVCLTEPGLRIDIAVQRPHDGLVCGDRIYFTTVNGNVVIADRRTLAVREVIDLNAINGSQGPLGWCRGLLPLDERLVWVGFTRVRKTQFMENLNWLKHGFRDVDRPTRIALYDVKARQCLKEINLEPFGGGVVFGIYPAE